MNQNVKLLTEAAAVQPALTPGIIYANADVFLDKGGNGSTPSTNCYNAYVQTDQICFCLAATGGTNVTTGARRFSYLEFTLGTKRVTSANLKLYNYWYGDAPPPNGNGGRPADSYAMIFGTKTNTPVTFSETTSNAIVTTFPPISEDRFLQITPAPGLHVTAPGWYAFDITDWYNARLGQTTTLLLHANTTTGFDFPLYEDRENTAFRVGAVHTIPDAGPRIEYFLPAAPQIVSVSASGNALILSAHYSLASTFCLLSSTDLSLPLINWARLSTNQFDTSGNCILTNTISPGSSQQYYRLLLE